MFVDRAEIIIESGKGGNGAVTFRHDPYVPDGGPDGGDGGNGGSVVFVADPNLNTLMDLRLRHKYKAQNGEDGMKRKRYGKSGDDLFIKVPVGTMVFDKKSGHLMKDLANQGDKLIAARGGRGGRGNVHYKSSIRQAPNFAEAGEAGILREVILELKLIADVGLIGFPNVGKSSLLASITNAKPKIANYHFTTIEPNLGVCEHRDRAIVFADIAGLIEGASEGQGLGHKFLKHIERTRVLVHVIDISGFEDRDPVQDYLTINQELVNFNPKLASKPQIIAANKIDIINDNTRYENFVKYIESQGLKVFPISAATGSGIDTLLDEILLKLNETPAFLDEDYIMFDFDSDIPDDYKQIKADLRPDGSFELSGGQLLKIFNSTNFTDTSSIRYLYNYIKKQGGIDMLKSLGLKDGDTVRIEDFEFEYSEDD